MLRIGLLLKLSRDERLQTAQQAAKARGELGRTLAAMTLGFQEGLRRVRKLCLREVAQELVQPCQ
eukprot:7705668-Lingulodinium_polyedra.AAC.1